MSFQDLSDDELAKLIGDRIRAARIEAGLTSTEMIKLVKISKSSYYFHETGTGAYSLSVLNRICLALGRSVSELLQTDEESERIATAERLHKAATEAERILAEAKSLGKPPAQTLTELTAIIRDMASSKAPSRRARSWTEEIIASRLAGKVPQKRE